MIAALDAQGIITIIGALVAAVIAILNALQKQKYANTIRSLWSALGTAATFVAPSQDPANETPSNGKVRAILSAGTTSKEALGDFVHEVISEYQRNMTPGGQKLKGLAGNGDWEKVLEKVIRP